MSRAKTPKEPTDQAGIAKAIGISTRVLRDNFARGCPRGPIAAIEKWRADNLSPAKRETDPDQSFASIEREKAKEQLRTIRMKNDLLEGRLVPRADVDSAIGELLSILRSRFERIPTDCEMLIPKNCRATVKREIAGKVNLALTEASECRI